MHLHPTRARFETFDVQNTLVISDNLSFVGSWQTHIQPDTTPDFWEIRIAGENGYQTIGMGGSKAFSEVARGNCRKPCKASN